VLLFAACRTFGELTGDSFVAAFSGSLVDENTIRGVVDGGGLSRYPLTIFRQ